MLLVPHGQSVIWLKCNSRKISSHVGTLLRGKVLVCGLTVLSIVMETVTVLREGTQDSGQWVTYLSGS